LFLSRQRSLVSNLVASGGWLADDFIESKKLLTKGLLLEVLKAHKLEVPFKDFVLQSSIITIKQINSKEVTVELLVAFLSTLPLQYAWKRNPKTGELAVQEERPLIVVHVPVVVLAPVVVVPLPAVQLVAVPVPVVVAPVPVVVAPVLFVQPCAVVPVLAVLATCNKRKQSDSSDQEYSFKKQRLGDAGPPPQVRPVLQVGAHVKFNPTRKNAATQVWLYNADSYGVVISASGRKWCVRWHLPGEVGKHVDLTHESLDLYTFVNR